MTKRMEQFTNVLMNWIRTGNAAERETKPALYSIVLINAVGFRNASLETL